MRVIFRLKNILRQLYEKQNILIDVEDSFDGLMDGIEIAFQFNKEGVSLGMFEQFLDDKDNMVKVDSRPHKLANVVKYVKRLIPVALNGICFFIFVLESCRADLVELQEVFRLVVYYFSGHF